jgi:hypothetical protein
LGSLSRSYAHPCPSPDHTADATLKALGAALSEQGAWLAADAESLQRLLEVMLGANDEPTQQLAGYALPSADAAGLGTALLAAADAEAAAAAAISRLSGSGSAAAVAAYVARLLLALAMEWAPAGQLLACCQRLLAGAASMRAPVGDSPQAQQRSLLLSDAASCFTARRMELLLQQHAGEAATATLLHTWCGLLEPTGAAWTAGARLAALQQVEGRVFALLPAEARSNCLKVRISRKVKQSVSQSGRQAGRQACLTCGCFKTSLSGPHYNTRCSLLCQLANAD